MRIKVDLKSLRQTKWYECASRFALGGAINVIAALLANKFGPAVGGRFLAFPAIFPASATLVEKHEIEKKAQKGVHGEKRGRDAAALDAAGAILGSIGLVLFVLLVWLMLPDHSSWLTLCSAGLFWFVSSCCVCPLGENRRKIFRLQSHPSTLPERHATSSGSHFTRSPDDSISRFSLLVSQCHYWINARGSSCWNQSSKQRSQHKDDRTPDEAHGIEWL